MRTDELLDEYQRFMDQWNIFYRKMDKNPVLPLMGEDWMQEFHDTYGSVGIFLEDTGVMLEKAHEMLHAKGYHYPQQDDIVGQWQEAECERKMEEGIVKCETMFEPDAHTYEPGDY